MIKYDQQYKELVERILAEGVWVKNERTGKRCLTIINHDLVYDVGAGEVPLLTTKKCATIAPVAELIGYFRRYTNAQQFADIGTKTWFDNANKTKAWLRNEHRRGQDDMGVVYGAATQVSELEDIYRKLLAGIDDRGLIYQMWVTGNLHKGCLRPCAFMHLWSLLDTKLSLTVTQRSVDVALGLPFNSFSFAWALNMMGSITCNTPDKVFHKLTNVHIYEDQIDLLVEQIARKPIDCEPKLTIPYCVQDLRDVTAVDFHAREYFNLKGYRHHDAIKFPFSE